jgi:glycosyltransferase involved in cell wall biosynthesis
MLLKSRYTVLTNVYNEEDRIPRLFDEIEKQTILPAHWVLIDDGSTDSTASIIETLSSRSPVDIISIQMPQKTKPDINTVGRSYEKALPVLKDLSSDYGALMDVDGRIPSNYFERMLSWLDNHPRIGVVAPKNPKNPALRTMPSGGGKVFRWAILQQINSVWDLHPDTFLNIIALASGYKIAIRYDIEILAPPTFLWSKEGHFRRGRRSYYVSRNPLLVIASAITSALRMGPAHGSALLRGYWQEWVRGSWNCNIPVVRYYYSLTRLLRKLLQREKDVVFIESQRGHRYC